MKAALSLAALLLASPPASASWFEFCRLEGRVESAKLVTAVRARTFEIVVAVTEARPDETAGMDGYTDCTEHLGKSLGVTLRIPRKHGKLGRGDRITFTRSAVDSFDPQSGFEGTHVQAKLLDYAVER